MALEIAYFTGADGVTREVYGKFVVAETLTLTATSQAGIVAPAGAAIARITAGENCRVGKGASPTVAATTGWYMVANDIMDISVTPGEQFAAMTV